MDPEDLEQEILGDEARIKPDPETLRDKFRQWIEPILAVLVAVLIGLVTWLLVLTLDVQGEQADDSVERARGTANVCRLLNGLGLDPADDPDGRCLDPEVYKYWSQYEGEITRSASTAGDVLDMICGFVVASPDNEALPEQCEGRDITIPG